MTTPFNDHRRLSIWGNGHHSKKTEADDFAKHIGYKSTPTQNRTYRNPAFAPVLQADSSFEFDPDKPLAIQLCGRRILSDGSSIACTTKTISRNVVEVACEQVNDPLTLMPNLKRLMGAQIALDLDRIGRFRGKVTADHDDGFTLAVDDTFKDMLTQKLQVFATPKIPTERIEPLDRNCIFTLPSGEIRRARLINISRVDALLKCANRPEVATTIQFGGALRLIAEVARTFEIGCEVKFLPPISAAAFSNKIRLHDD